MSLLLVLLLATAAGDDAATAEARALYAKGKEAFEAGRNTEALSNFEGAYSRKPLPGFLFNIALCHRALKNHGKAISALERYLRAMPNAPNRAEAENLLDEERALAAAPPVAPAVPPSPPPTPPATAPPVAAPPPVTPPPVTPPPVTPPPVTPPPGAPPPSEVAPLAPAVPPPSAKPAPAPKPTPKPDELEPVQGLDTMPVAAIQTAAGLGACVGGCCVASPFACVASLVPVAGPFISACIAALIIGPAIAIAEVWAGDGLGKARSALLLPAAAAVGAIALSGLTGATIVTVAPPTLQNGDVTASRWAVWIAGIAGCCGATVAVIGPVVLYHLMAVDKEPGDRGGFPGIVEPADPTGTRGKPRAEAPAAPRTALAMRY